MSATDLSSGRADALAMLRLCPATSFQTEDPDGTSWVQWNRNRAELMLSQRFS